MVSNSSNKINQTWPEPFSRALYKTTLVFDADGDAFMDDDEEQFNIPSVQLHPCISFNFDSQQLIDKALP